MSLGSARSCPSSSAWKNASPSPLRASRSGFLSLPLAGILSLRLPRAQASWRSAAQNLAALRTEPNANFAGGELENGRGWDYPASIDRGRTITGHACGGGVVKRPTLAL